MASLPSGGTLVAGLPMPAGLNAIMSNLSAGTSQYWALYRQRRIIRMTYFLLLLMLTALVFFSSSWLALYVSRQMTRPLEALADATVEIGKGDYSHRVTVAATAEMAELVRSFNHMAADLEQSRSLAETSARELSAANLAIESRRKELETILETIPSGVVTLDASRRILLGNRAFAEVARIDGQKDLAGVQLDSLLPLGVHRELARLDVAPAAWVPRRRNSSCIPRVELRTSPSRSLRSIRTTARAAASSSSLKTSPTSSTRSTRPPGKRSPSASRTRFATRSRPSPSPPSASAATSIAPRPIPPASSANAAM